MNFAFLDLEDVAVVTMLDDTFIISTSGGWYIFIDTNQVLDVTGKKRHAMLHSQGDWWSREDREAKLNQISEWLKENNCLFLSFEEALEVWQKNFKGLEGHDLHHFSKLRAFEHLSDNPNRKRKEISTDSKLEVVASNLKKANATLLEVIEGTLKKVTSLGIVIIIYTVLIILFCLKIG